MNAKRITLLKGCQQKNALFLFFFKLFFIMSVDYQLNWIKV